MTFTPADDHTKMLNPASGKRSNRQAISIDAAPVIVENSIDGTPADDRLVGSAASDGISGKDGNDDISGLAGFDLLSGDRGNDRISGDAGSDRLFGNQGRDRLEGGSGNDTIWGTNLSSKDNQRDVLSGDNGNDDLIGGGGNNILIGGQGRDVFVLDRGQGFDRILDFESGQDRIGLIGIPGVEGNLRFSDLTLLQQGRNTVIKSSFDKLAVLVGVNANSLTANDFASVIFAL